MRIWHYDDPVRAADWADSLTRDPAELHPASVADSPPPVQALYASGELSHAAGQGRPGDA